MGRGNRRCCLARPTTTPKCTNCDCTASSLTYEHQCPGGSTYVSIPYKAADPDQDGKPVIVKCPGCDAEGIPADMTPVYWECSNCGWTWPVS